MIFLWFCCYIVFQGGTGDKLLVGTHRTFLLVDPDTNRTDTWEVEEPDSWPAHAMAYHQSKGLLFYAVSNLDTFPTVNSKLQTLVKRISIPFKKYEKPLTIKTKGVVPELAIDWIEDRIYLLYSQDCELEVADLNGDNDVKLITKQKVKEATYDIQPPLSADLRLHDLVVDPINKIAFVTVTEVHVNATNPRGSGRSNILFLYGTTLKSILAIEFWSVLELNAQQKTLYMYLLRSNTLVTFNYGADVETDLPVFSHIHYKLSDMGIFTVFGSKLYWFDHDNNNIYKINLLKGVISQELYHHVQTISVVFDFKVIDPQAQTNGNDLSLHTCAIEGCSHGCAMVGLATCTCPACFKLNDDYKTCSDEMDPYLEQFKNRCQKLKENNGTFVLNYKKPEEPEGRLCQVPEHPGSVISWFPCASGQVCTLSSWSTLGHDSLIEIDCSPGLKLLSGVTKAYRICRFGVWDPPIPQCFKLCPPLKSRTLDLQCWQGSEPISCNQLQLPNTTITYQCKEFHEASYASQPSGIRCESDGTWTRELPRCTPKCGLSNLKISESGHVIKDKNTIQPGNFPWHAAIYLKKSNHWEAVCGGTLVSSKVILTAAHCVTVSCQKCNTSVMAKDDMMIALGKTHKDWNILDATETKKTVKEIHVHPNYVGSALNYIADVALIILESDVEINSFTMPACVDYSKTHAPRVTSKTKGYVMGWGTAIIIGDTPSDLFKYTKTSIFDFGTCYKLIESVKGQPVARITPDKFCSSNSSEPVVQGGDSGGGLTFNFDGIHYVYGIVSNELKIEIDNHNSYNFAVFTSIPKYIDWLSSSLY